MEQEKLRAEQSLKERTQIVEELKRFDFEIKKKKKELISKTGDLLNRFEFHTRNAKDLQQQIDKLLEEQRKNEEKLRNEKREKEDIRSKFKLGAKNEEKPSFPTR